MISSMKMVAGLLFLTSLVTAQTDALQRRRRLPTKIECNWNGSKHLKLLRELKRCRRNYSKIKVADYAEPGQTIEQTIEKAILGKSTNVAIKNDLKFHLNAIRKSKNPRSKRLANIKNAYNKVIVKDRPDLVKFYEAAGLTPDKLLTNIGKYLPVDVLFRCKRFFTPELDPTMREVLKKSKYNKTVPKDALNNGCKIGLHGTTAWHTILTEGLKTGTNFNVGSKGDIFHAISAGRHESANEELQFTTLSYGTKNEWTGSTTCRFVISLLTSSSTPVRPNTGGWGKISGWLTSKRENTIPLWMVEIDALDFLELLIRKYSASYVTGQVNRFLFKSGVREIPGYRLKCRWGGSPGKLCANPNYCKVCYPKSRRRMAEREFSSQRESPVMLRLLEEIMNANA